MRRVMIRGLKMCEVSRTEFDRRFGVSMESVFGTEIEQLVEKEWLQHSGDRYELTKVGQMFSTNVYELFYTDSDLSPAREDEVRFGISELVE